MNKMRYSTFINIILLFFLIILSFLNSYLFIDKTWSSISYFLLFSVSSIILLIIKFDIKKLIYISICLLPCLNYFIPLGLFSITLPELFIAMTVLIYFINNNLILNKYIILNLVLLIICILSLFGSPVSFFILGTFLRFVFIIFFTIILYSVSSKAIFLKFIINGIFTIPIIAISAYLGEGFFLHLISTNFFSFQRVIYSFQYPIWLSLILPLLIYFKLSKKIITIYFIFCIYMIFLSYARSIYIGFFISLLIFIFFHRSNFSLIFKKSITLIFLALCIVVYSIISLYISRISFTS